MNIKKTLGVMLALTIAVSMFAGGAAAFSLDKTEQKANSQVWQQQNVNQQNFNNQKAAAVSISKYTKKGGNAAVVQASSQSNKNVQYADSEAENEIED